MSNEDNQVLLSNQLQDSEQRLANSLRQNPRDANALFEVGCIRQQQGKHLDAIDYFERALDSDASMILPRLRMSGSLEELGMFEAAAAQLEQALELEADNAVVYHALGVNYQQSGKLLQARDAFLRAIELRTTSDGELSELEKRAQEAG